MAPWPKKVKFMERTQVASDIQVMNDTTPIHGIATLGLSKDLLQIGASTSFA
jgi:hypothetical protein